MGASHAVFLDRDGTINADRSDYIKSWEEFRFLPRALDALRRLARLEVEIIVVTNQSAIGRRMIGTEVVSEINRRMIGEVERHSGRITGVYVCPHAPWVGCPCRKPKPGLLLQAAEDHRLDLLRSFMVGDRLSDAEAALAAGCQPILIASDQVRFEAKKTPSGSLVVGDLYRATRHIEETLKSWEAPRGV